jgi:hypothetical protein
VAVAGTDAQLPLAGVVYVTVYVPGVLKLGVIDPVVVLIIKPDNGGTGVPDVDVTAYVPPV